VPPTPNAHANVGVPSRELGPADDRPSPVIVRFWRRLRHYLVALWSNKTRLRYLVGVIIIGVVPIVVLLLPRVIAEYDIGQPKFGKLDPDKLGTEVNSVRTALLQALAGLVLIVGARSAARQLQVAREGQVTDRYTKAIDQLGDDKSLAVRIGGIYALERIAKDSKADRVTIVEVLAAFVRAHAPPAPSQPTGSEDPPPADVQTALTVLGRLPRPDVLVIDLARIDLTGANLAGANLAYANLAYTNLTHADFTYAILYHADLTQADLSDANLIHASLTDANVGGAVYSERDKETRGTIWPDGFYPIGAGAVSSWHP
jgi:hypothetical protein